MTAVTYDDRTGVGSNRQTALPAPAGSGSRGRVDRDDRPVVRRGDGEGEGRLEVRLLEDREDPARVGHLELGVEVDLAVDRVDEAVQPLAGVHVDRSRR